MFTAPTKAIFELPLMRMVRTFEQNMSRDTVFNLFALQTKIDDWFSAMPQAPDDQQLTQKDLRKCVLDAVGRSVARFVTRDGLYGTRFGRPD